MKKELLYYLYAEGGNISSWISRIYCREKYVDITFEFLCHNPTFFLREGLMFACGQSR